MSAGTTALSAENPEAPLDVAAILFHEILDRPFLGFPSRHLVFFVLAALAVLLLARLALRGYRDGVPHGLAAAVEMVVVFVRDEIATKMIGDEGRRFASGAGWRRTWWRRPLPSRANARAFRSR